MYSDFSKSQFHGYLIKGDLYSAIRYIKAFPEQADRYHKYKSLFEDEQYLIYDVDEHLNQILTIYQQYYRDIFYLKTDPEKADSTLLERFSNLFDLHGCIDLLTTAEQKIVAAFADKGYHILCGRTSGYFGPYIWKNTESITYEVELPSGIQKYPINFLDGFISKSWLDYISFGEVGTGGWTNGDGIINCVKSSYDLESESFRVSLLKHEAQHAMDLSKYASMTSEDLEYRAKLVELIYSRERNLLAQFRREADLSHAANGHSMAANRIAKEFSGISADSQVPIRALELLRKSDTEMAGKYG